MNRIHTGQKLEIWGDSFQGNIVDMIGSCHVFKPVYQTDIKNQISDGVLSVF